MKNKVILSLVFTVCASLLFSQVTTTTIADGSYTSAATWDNGVPTSIDTVIILNTVSLTSSKGAVDVTIGSGGSLEITSSGKLTVSNLCQIDLGGLLTNDALFVCNGDYILNGEHAGSAVIRLGVGGDISGTGLCSNTNKVSITGGDRTILAGSDLDFTSLQFTLFDAVTVTNNGILQTDFLKGQSTGETWVQGTNSQLIVNSTNVSILLDASATGNLVSLNDTSNGLTDVLSTTTSEYYDLEINGNGQKRLRGDITILNDLILNGSELEVLRSGIIYDITIMGDWINNGGEFAQSAGNVFFTGIDQSIDIASGNELFYNLNFFNTGTLTQNGDIVVLNDLTYTADYDLNGYTTTILGDWMNLGSFQANGGLVNFSGFSAQDIDGSSVFHDLTINNFSSVDVNSGTQEVFGTLSLNNGTFNTNDELVIGSNAVETGRIGTVTGGSISGEVTVERFFDPVFQGWHLLGAATANNTLANWEDDFLMIGFNGATYPTYPFNNVQLYDETILGDKDLGLVGATDTSDAISIGLGWRIYLDNEPMEIETKGEVHTGDFSFSLTYTPDLGSADDGWNLISNPYASGIDWDSFGWTKTNINDAIYVWDGDLGLYNSYIGGVSTNGGSNIIPSSQAFWVQSNAASPALTITENDKSSNDGTFKNTSDLEVVNLYIEDGVNSDQIAIVFRENASLNFESNFDAYKFYSENDIPKMASVTPDSTELSINSIPFLDENTSIPLNIQAIEGQYTIRTYDDISIPGTSCAVIEDLLTGEQVPLESNHSLTFDWTGANIVNPRFVIHFTAVAELEVSSVSCNGSNDGTVVAQGPQTGPWDYTWYDVDGNVLLQDFNVSGSSEINALSPGEYSVEIVHANSCGNDLVQFEITEPSATEFEIIDSAVDECNSNNNGMIEFTVSNGDINSTWDIELYNQENQLVNALNGINDTITLPDLSGDVYTLVASNACDNFTEAITLEDSNASQSAFELSSTTINLALGQTLMPNNTSVNATDYSWDFGDGSSSFNVNPIHEYTATGNYSVQLTASNSLCEDHFEIDVDVIDQVVGINELNPENFNVYLAENGQLVITNDNFIQGPIIIKIRNLVGQQVYSKEHSSLNGQIEIEPLDVPESIYLISLMKGDDSLLNRKIKL